MLVFLSLSISSVFFSFHNTSSFMAFKWFFHFSKFLSLGMDNGMFSIFSHTLVISAIFFPLQPFLPDSCMLKFLKVVLDFHYSLMFYSFFRNILSMSVVSVTVSRTMILKFFFLALNSLRHSIPVSNWPQYLHLDISKAPKLYILDLNPWPSFQTFPSCSVSLYSKVAWITLKIYIQNLWWDRFELSLRSNSLKEKFINGNSFNKIAS